MEVDQAKTPFSAEKQSIKNDARGMIISFQQQQPGVSGDDDMENEEITLPQLVATSTSSSSNKTEKSWMERLIWSCGGGAHAIDDANTAIMVVEEDTTSIPKTRDELDEKKVPMEINAIARNSSHCSPISIATEQGTAPSWTTNVANYDFAALLNLLSELDEEHDNARPVLHTVRCLLEQDKWSIVFDSMSPKEYASLIMTFDSEFDRPEIAALIAPSVNGGDFTHEYIIAVLDAVADWSRAPLITKLLPLCRDINENSEKIKAQLSEWDVVCTKGVFEMAKR